MGFGRFIFWIDWAVILLGLYLSLVFILTKCKLMTTYRLAAPKYLRDVRDLTEATSVPQGGTPSDAAFATEVWWRRDFVSSSSARSRINEVNHLQKGP